jgi:hypothetical protein
VDKEGRFVRAQWSSHQNTAAVGEHRHGTNAVGIVVIAGDDDDGAGAIGGKALDEGIEQADSALRRCATIEDIAGKNENVRSVRADGIEHLGEDGGMIVVERVKTELSAEVPIRRVKQFHCRCLLSSQTFYTALDET